MTDRPKPLASYLRRRAVPILLLLFAAVLFPLVFFAFRCDIYPALYSTVIFAFAALCGAAGDFIAWRRRVLKLRIAVSETAPGDAELPDPENEAEELYQELVRSLRRTVAADRTALDTIHNEQLDYYTLWLHQIKTPISALRLILGDSGDPAGLLELFKIERYVDMALQYVKLGDMSGDMVVGECPLAPVVAQSLKKYSVLFIRRRLELELGDDEVTVTTDGKWLAFIFEQLLSNAIKYTPPGGKIKIYAEADRLTVEDGGVGIRPEDLPRVFEKGYTGYNGRLDKRASGIGLFMAKKVADRLSVTIEITSEEGKGTRASLIFPSRPAL